jgi:hypothetical protein
MSEKQNELLITRILECIPNNMKPIELLMELLNIGKESAYRRMRGEIPFTFEEIIKLALTLDFSVDEIIGKNKEERIFLDLLANSASNHEESFLAMMQEYYRYIELLAKAQEKELYATFNRITLALLIGYDTLFKLYYYHWKHQTYNVSINDLFSEVTIPPEINAIRLQFKHIRPLMNNVNYIIDRGVFLNIVREIQYYYNRKLISDEEIVILKEELCEVLKNIEVIMQTGYNEYGSATNYYLSMLDIESNMNCATYDGNIASLYWLYPVNSIVIVNQEICNMQKKWIESIKKYSILVTLSNEILQTEFISKQYEYLEDMTKEFTLC